MQSNITIIVPHHTMPLYHTIIIVILTSQVTRENEEKQIPATNISFSEKLKNNPKSTNIGSLHKNIPVDELRIVMKNKDVFLIVIALYHMV